jgi:hypothetical protein
VQRHLDDQVPEREQRRLEPAAVDPHMGLDLLMLGRVRRLLC